MTHTLRRSGWLLLAAAFAAGCGAEDEAARVAETVERELAERAALQLSEREADAAAIREAQLRIDSAVGRADWERSLEEYAEDAAVMLPNRPAVEGRDSIRAFFAGWPAVQGSTELVELEPRGDLAYARTRHRLTMRLPTGTVIADSGKGVQIWRKGADGRWRILRDISSSDVRRGGPGK